MGRRTLPNPAKIWTNLWSRCLKDGEKDSDKSWEKRIPKKLFKGQRAALDGVVSRVLQDLSLLSKGLWAALVPGSTQVMFHNGLRRTGQALLYWHHGVNV